MLRHLKPESGIQCRADDRKRVIAGNARIREPHSEVRARRQPLQVAYVCCGRILRRTAENAGALKARVVTLQSRANDRVKAGNRRTNTQSRTYQSIGAGADST